MPHLQFYSWCVNIMDNRRFLSFSLPIFSHQTLAKKKAGEVDLSFQLFKVYLFFEYKILYNKEVEMLQICFGDVSSAPAKTCFTVKDTNKENT